MPLWFESSPSSFCSTPRAQGRKNSSVRQRYSSQRSASQSLSTGSNWVLAVWSPTWAILPPPWGVLVGRKAHLDCLPPTEPPATSWGSFPQALGVDIAFTCGPGA